MENAFLVIRAVFFGERTPAVPSALGTDAFESTAYVSPCSRPHIRVVEHRGSKVFRDIE